ncbi:MAG: AP-1 complex subunit mu-1 [Marteilia pararefringens]
MSSWSAICLFDLRGSIIVKKIFHKLITENELSSVSHHIATNMNAFDDPITYFKDISAIFMKKDTIYLSLLSKSNSNLVSGYAFLEGFYSLITSYIGPATPQNMINNLPIMKEILDESIISGCPQLTDFSLMKEYITDVPKLQTFQAQGPPKAVTNANSFRNQNIVYQTNEVFVDFIEELNYKLSKSGNITQSEIIGTIILRAHLSGMPEVKLLFNNIFSFADTNIIDFTNSRSICDFKFHQCVYNKQAENENNIVSFNPPDGKFILMNYRVPCKNPPTFDVTTSIFSPTTESWVYNIKFRMTFPSPSQPEKIILEIPVNSEAESPTFNTKFGTCSYLPSKNILEWDLTGYKTDKSVCLSINLKRSTNKQMGIIKNQNDLDETMLEASIQKPIIIHFTLPFYSMSGIQVLSMNVFEKGCYNVDKYISTISRDGKVQIF